MAATSTGRGVRERRREETRERIYQAALAEFRQVGFSAAQIDRIAAAAGVVRGTFYFHFPSKEEVLLELRARCAMAVIGRLHSLDPSKVYFDDLLATLLEGVQAWQEVEPDEDLQRELAALEMRRGTTREREGGPSPAVRGLRSVLEGISARGDLRPESDCEELAELMIAGCIGVVVRTLGEPERRNVMLTRLVDVLRHGMENPGPRS